MFNIRPDPSQPPQALVAANDSPSDFRNGNHHVLKRLTPLKQIANDQSYSNSDADTEQRILRHLFR